VLIGSSFVIADLIIFHKPNHALRPHNVLLCLLNLISIIQGNSQIFLIVRLVDSIPLELTLLLDQIVDHGDYFTFKLLLIDFLYQIITNYHPYYDLKSLNLPKKV